MLRKTIGTQSWVDREGGEGLGEDRGKYQNTTYKIFKELMFRKRKEKEKSHHSPDQLWVQKVVRKQKEKRGQWKT